MTVHRLLSSIFTFRQNQHCDAITNKTLDLAYILPNLIVCSGPVDDQLHKHHRPNRLSDLTNFLNRNHGSLNWSFFNLRAEQLGYELSEDFNLSYYPFIDHEAPPFHMLLEVIDAINKWLEESEHVAVLHCKAGKGRSGTVACCYLMFKDSTLTPNRANEIFSGQRFTSDFNNYGVSILSQRRYINYFYHYLNNKRLKDKFDLLNCQVTTKITRITITKAVDASITIDIHVYDDKKLLRLFQLSNPKMERGILIYNNTKDEEIKASDIRISFNHFIIDSMLLQIPSSSNFCWFNSIIDLYGTKYLSREKIGEVIIGEDKITLSNKKFLNWDELDGFKGTYQRGIKLFQKFEIEYEISYNGENIQYINSCGSEQPKQGSHIRRMLSYHRNNN